MILSACVCICTVTSTIINPVVYVCYLAPSATPGADYNPMPNPTSVNFMSGNPIECTTLEVFPDDADEPDEFLLIQAIPVGGQISILDDNSDVIIADTDSTFTP